MIESAKTIQINRLAIIGVGLIGGSFALAMRENIEGLDVIGYGRSVENLKRATDMGIIDSWTTVLSKAVCEADVVMIATPVGAIPGLFEKLKDYVPPECIVTDTGSAKREIVEAAHRSFVESKVRFVPGHPIAGREKSGIEAAVGNLFVGQKVILTPTEDTDNSALDRIRTVWCLAGAFVMHMPPEKHDQLLALTSHLPHMIAYALVNLLADQDDADGDCLRLAAGGFYDISRVASSDPVMWRDICLTNRDELVLRLNEYQMVIGSLAALVESKDSQSLEEFFIRAKITRKRIEDVSKDRIN